MKFPAAEPETKFARYSGVDRAKNGKGSNAWRTIMMDAELEDRIRKRAHELWEAHGKPEGRDDDFWHQAESEVRGKDTGAATGTVTVPLGAD
jgi:hypothetical protein